MKTLFFICSILFSITLSDISLPQDNKFQQNLNSNKKVSTQAIIFNDIESGINSSDVTKISKYFAPQPYISLINGVNGYYSSNQAYYILEDFFDTYKVLSFKLDESKIDEAISYAKGEYYFEKKGKREIAHLYVTLSKSGSRWQITQISIN